MTAARAAAVAFACGLCCLPSVGSGAATRADPVEERLVVTRIRPEVVYAERRGAHLRLNFDVELLNRRNDPIEIIYLELRVFAPDGRFLTRAHIGSNGLPGPISEIPKRIIEPGDTLYLFNPFPDLPMSERAGRIELRLFHSAGREDLDIALSEPPGPVLERLPLNEPGFVFSGNDAHSHHRRVALDSDAAVELGLETVAQRFALDLTVVDLQSGDLAEPGADDVEDFFAVGTQVVAPTDGTIVNVRSDMPDNSFSSSGELVKPAEYEQAGDDASLGNYVMLDTGGAYLVMSHFRADSVPVRAGDFVNAGEPIGEIGLSGDTVYPHLHMQLQDSADPLEARPLPIIFECVRLGADPNPPEFKFVSIDTGMFARHCGN